MSRLLERIGLVFFIIGVVAAYSPLTTNLSVAIVVMVLGCFIYIVFGVGMKLSEYSDDELIEAVKHRGIKIEIDYEIKQDDSLSYYGIINEKVKIGGVVFDLRT